jgi:hypothetical protein
MARPTPASYLKDVFSQLKELIPNNELYRKSQGKCSQSPNYHPKLSPREQLSNVRKAVYQKIGILTWIRSRLRVDIAYVLSIINQFVASPREDTLTQW